MKYIVRIVSIIGIFSTAQLSYAVELFVTGETLTADKLNALVPKTYAIGDIGPAGGWVFYVTNGGLHGLEAAPEDQAIAYSPGAVWGCSGTEISGADGTTVGAGAQNTGDILTGCMEPNIAARIADNYWLNGYNDWFLPSRDELNEMYLNIGQGNTTNSNVGGFNSDTYWSSSESAVDAVGDSAWNRFFGTGAENGDDPYKVWNYGVRAVRAF